MADIRESLKAVMEIDGALGASIINRESGVPLGTIGGGALDMELAGAGSAVVVRTQLQVFDEIGIEQAPEDILITLDRQYHLLRFFHDTGDVFTYIVLNRDAANLALARRQLKKIDQNLELG